MGGLYVAIDLGRISRSEAAYLSPAIRAWYLQKTNSDAAYWARGLERMGLGNYQMVIKLPNHNMQGDGSQPFSSLPNRESGEAGSPH
jgi:hypothetical protein